MDDLTAFQMDGSGAAKPVLPKDISVPRDGQGFAWVNALATSDTGHSWIDEAGLPALAHSALLAEETRPRCTVHDDWVLMNLRGVNLNPGAEPEDMVSLRLYLTGHYVVSVQKRNLQALSDVVDEAARGIGPTSPGDLVARIALRLADRAEPVVARLNERIDDMEEAAESKPVQGLRAELADIRRVSIVLRRYMFPQRDALSTLEIEDLTWINGHDRSRLREATERMTRLGEELDAIRDRAQVVHDMLMDMRAEVMNRQMLLLSVVAAIFLPLGLITGLLGINVGGIPGTDYPWAFWMVCVMLLAIGSLQLWLFRKLGLLGLPKGKD